MPDLHEYTVNLHVHTTYSDGTGSMEEVIAAAGRAGVDVLMITDHDTLGAKRDGWDGWHGRVLVIVGLEYSGPHNHYLAFGPEEYSGHDWRNPAQFIAETARSGGVGFCAHPHEKGSPLSEGGRTFTWDDWEADGFTGLEIWNYSSAWKTLAQTVPRGLFSLALRRGTLPGPEPETLAKWDDLGRIRRAAGVGGSDAHAAPFRLFGLLKTYIFPYPYLFRAVNTHILAENPFSGDPERDRSTVLGALAEGSCFVSHDRLRSGRGFDFWLENNGRRRAGQGGETQLQQGDRLAWRLPARVPARLLKDGRPVLEMTHDRPSINIAEPGVYRLEASYPVRAFGPRPWIFSNPVYVRT